MPLPQPNTPWPPPDLVRAFAQMREHDAWYAGQADRLAQVIGQLGPQVSIRPSQLRGGLVGAVARFFWGAPTPIGAKRSKIHVPLPADIATANSDLLFARPPGLKFKQTSNNTRWQTLDDKIHWRSRLAEAGEVCSPLGGVYLRAGWDTEVAGHPLFTVVHHDRAVPEFLWGSLHAVTLWTDLAIDSGIYLRYLQRHEMVPDGRGGRVAVELNGLFKGTADNLGGQVALESHPFTADLDPIVSIGSPVLPIAYVPNMYPSRENRASELGRSDFEGITPLFDSLDETFSSWMRDVRAAKARIITPSAYLTSLGPGQGAEFDLDREVYEQINVPPTAGVGITVQQFAIRTAEHEATMMRTIRQAVGTAGYSGSTFGLEEQGGGGEQTATEVNDRRNRSILTREKKTAYWGEGLQHIAAAMLWIDRLVFRSSVDPEDVPTVDWPDAAGVDQLKLAQTVAAWETARAASTEIKVRAIHPEWPDGEVNAEVRRILDEQGAATADPVDMLNSVANSGNIVSTEDSDADIPENIPG